VKSTTAINFAEKNPNSAAVYGTSFVQNLSTCCSLLLLNFVAEYFEQFDKTLSRF
jgi:hypothetical protein